MKPNDYKNRNTNFLSSGELVDELEQLVHYLYLHLQHHHVVKDIQMDNVVPVHVQIHQYQKVMHQQQIHHHLHHHNNNNNKIIKIIKKLIALIYHHQKVHILLVIQLMVHHHH